MKFSRAHLKRGDFDKPTGPGRPLWTGVPPYGYLDFRPFGRDPERVEVVTKVRVSIHPDRAVARQRMRQVLTFYNIAEFYSDLLISQGFQQEVTAIREAFQQGGFKAAMAQMTDDYMDRLPVVLGTSVEEVKEQLQPFVEAGVTRLIIPYVPTGDAVVEDAWRFLHAWEAAR